KRVQVNAASATLPLADLTRTISKPPRKLPDRKAPRHPLLAKSGYNRIGLETARAPNIADVRNVQSLQVTSNRDRTNSKGARYPRLAHFFGRQRPDRRFFFLVKTPHRSLSCFSCLET